MSDMTIDELAKRTRLAVRTRRFYTDAGVLPEASRSASGYRLFGPEAVARGRMLRTLRELGGRLVILNLEPSRERSTVILLREAIGF